MYNMYGRSSKAQYSKDLLRSLKKKSVHFTVHPMKGTVLCKINFFLVLNEEVPGSNPRLDKQLKFFQDIF